MNRHNAFTRAIYTRQKYVFLYNVPNFWIKKCQTNMFLNIYFVISSLIFTKYKRLRARVNAVYNQR